MDMDFTTFDTGSEAELISQITSVVGDVGTEVVLSQIDTALHLSDKEKNHLRRLVDAASSILANFNDELAYSHSGFALTSLPYRAPKLDKAARSENNTSFNEMMVWQRKGHNVTLQIASGYDENGVPVGIPYGGKARLILYYLQTKAIQSQSRFIAFGETSLNEWLRKQGIAIGGNTYSQTREQARRISACRLAFLGEGEDVRGRRNSQFVRTAIELKSTKFSDDRQGELWQDMVELDEDFFRDLIRHAVPLPAGAIHTLADRPMALDILIWLIYRLNHITKTGTRVEVPWPALHAQFGFSFVKARQFKPEFITNLQLAVSCIPDAKLEMGELGLVLKPSPRLIT
jgi:hypothetical protein